MPRVKPPPGTKGPFVPGGGFTRDKRTPPPFVFFPLLSIFPIIVRGIHTNTAVLVGTLFILGYRIKCVPIYVGVPTRGPGFQLVNAACFLFPDDDARGNHSNARFILVPAAGPYVQQRECARALYYLAPGVLVVGGTSEAREGGKLPSLC